MRKKFISVFNFYLRTRKMSYFESAKKRLLYCGKSGSLNFSFPTNFIRRFSVSAMFNKIDTLSEVDSVLSDPDYEEMAEQFYRHPGMGHNLLVIQPRSKTGRKRDTKHSAELKLSEAVALVETLPNWHVIDKCVMSNASLDTKLVFGKGNLEKIRLFLRNRKKITGIFIGVDILTALQNVNLEKHFKVQIFDRYQIVLQIFHDHAHTKEAKLQVALAEIPYLRVKLCEFSHTFNSDTFTGIYHVGGSGETFMETRRRLLLEREIKIKRALDKLKKQRNLLRQNERRNSYPIVAVVGYTNCGKTTLIKALTLDSRMKPENRLFATLDVTLHAGFLPSSQKVLYVDTVGFISDVPTTLIEAFKATLEDIVFADLIVHVRDISHPDSEAQKAVVLETLKSLSLPDSLMDTIIEVGNKVDLLDKSDDVTDQNLIPISTMDGTNLQELSGLTEEDVIKTDQNLLPISATEGTNLQQLSELIEEGVIKNTGRCIKILRIPNGGEEYSWLYKEAAVREAVPDERDGNYLLVEVIISDANFAKFVHRYGDLSVCLPSST